MKQSLRLCGVASIREKSGNVTFKWENKVRFESRENTFKQKKHEKSKEWMTNTMKQKKNAECINNFADWLINQTEGGKQEGK
jgi:hypothetical protein